MLPDKFCLEELYINKNLLYLFNKEIIEYDMQSAGYSLIREYRLLPEEEIELLSHLGKKDQTIQIGKLQNKYPDFKKSLKEAFSAARNRFYLQNDLELDQILSVKKDAIFTLRSCKEQKVGDYINFREKNKYSSYVLLSASKGKSLELYYNPSKLDVKGISDEKVQLHQDHMLWFLQQWFVRMETMPPQEVLAYTRRFIDKYKRRELDVGFYRRFSPDSTFILKGDSGIRFTEYWNHAKEDLDISYNYFNILVKLTKIPL